MAIMRDPVTGHVRAILRDLPAGAMGPGALDALAPEPGLDNHGQRRASRLSGLEALT